MNNVFNSDNNRKSRIAQFLNVGTCLQALAVVTVLLFTATNAKADYLSLLTDGSSGSIGGALYTQGPVGSGTGVFPAFVRLSGNGQGVGDIVNGYNTTVGNVFDNTNDATHNHEITLSQIPQVSFNNVLYYQFFLDINELTGGSPSDRYLSLDEVQIWTSATPNQSQETLPLSLGTLVYSLDAAGEPDGVLLDYSLESGSGFADMTLLVPVSLFSGGPYVYLYSEFGALGEGTFGGVNGNFGFSDGFEEWAIGPAGPVTVIPEPSTYALYALGISMLFVSGWWQKRRTALNNSSF
jgi:hypothetical protein